MRNGRLAEQDVRSKSASSAFEQAKNGAHAGHPVERRHNMYLAGSGIRKAGIYASGR
jgi:hypothetical protein